MATTVDEKATLDVPEVARMLGIGERQAYAAVRTGKIPSLRFSPRRVVVPRKALDQLLASEAAKK